MCCVGFVGLCCGEFPTVARIIGAVCLIVAAVMAILYSGENIIIMLLSILPPKYMLYALF